MILGEEFVSEHARQHHYGLADAELRRSYIPYDYFGTQRYFDQSRFYGDFTAYKSRYWWRFERDGCTAVAAIGNRAIGERQDGRPISAQWWHPSLEYPAIRQYQLIFRIVRDYTLQKYSRKRTVIRSGFPGLAAVNRKYSYSEASESIR